MPNGAFGRGVQRYIQMQQLMQGREAQRTRGRYMESQMRGQEFQQQQALTRQRALEGIPTEHYTDLYGPDYGELAQALTRAGVMKPDVPTRFEAAGKPEKLSFENLMTRYLSEGKPVPESVRRAYAEFQAAKKVPKTEITIGGKVMPGAQVEKTAALQNFGSMLARIDETWDEAFTGPVEGRAGAIADKWGLDPRNIFGKEIPTEKRYKEIVFRQLTKQLGDDILRLRSGAQINEQEMKRMKEWLPNVNDPDNVFRARLNTLRETFEDIMASRTETFGRAGYRPPTKPSTGEMTRHKKEIYQKLAPSQKKPLGKDAQINAIEKRIDQILKTLENAK